MKGTSKEIVETFEYLANKKLGFYFEKASKRGPTKKFFKKVAIEDINSNPDLILTLEALDIDMKSYKKQLNTQKKGYCIFFFKMPEIYKLLIKFFNKEKNKTSTQLWVKTSETSDKSETSEEEEEGKEEIKKEKEVKEVKEEKINKIGDNEDNEEMSNIKKNEENSKLNCNNQVY